MGAVRAVTECENSGLYKAIFTGSVAHSYLAQMWGGYDASNVSIPWFMTAATGTSDDTGATDAATEWLGVAPLSSCQIHDNTANQGQEQGKYIR